MNNKRLPKIAILLATYNGEKFIEKQLSSINDYLSFNLKEAREKFEKEYLSAQIGRFSGNVSRTSSFIQMERSVPKMRF